MIALAYRDVRPIYTQIADGLREQILAGVLLPQDQLPSVRELAGQLTINPNTIQRAYRQLESEGWIVTVPGKGCFVSRIPDAAWRKRESLIRTFDETVSALQALGIPPAQLADRLLKGENNHA